MRVVHQLDLIIACFKNIAAGTERIEGSHVFRTERDRHSLGFAGLQKTGFAESCENDMRFFNAALCIRRGVVNLNDVFARNAAGVCDFDLHCDRIVAVAVSRDLLGKGRIGETVSKRILNRLLIIDISVGCRGFIVTVAYIDTFGIFDIVASEIAVGETARVPVSGGGGEIICISVDQTAGRIDCAGKYIADGVESDCAGASDPEDCVDTLFCEAEFHRVRGVDQNDRLCESLSLDECEKVFFILRQFQIVSSVIDGGVTCSIHVLRKIAALAADA